MLPDIDFRHIRGHGPLGSKADGFEELATELLEETVIDWPQGTRFERFGTPDGGREGRALLQSGGTWAWQAKYLFELDASAYAQITKSVRRAIEREPHLEKYFVICPYDLPAGDTDKARSAHTKWEEHAEEWRSEAEQRGLTVEFEYVGLHALVKALTRTEHVGRLRYWFDLSAFASEWFTAITSRAVANAGPRYTPELHVGLPIAGVFDGLGRTAAFERRLRELLGKIRSARRFGFRSPKAEAGHLDPLISATSDALDAVDAVLDAAVAVARGAGPMPDPGLALGDARTALQRLESEVYARCLPPGQNYFVGDAASLYHTVREASKAVHEAHSFVNEPAWAAAERRLLLVTGDGGTGKTHLMCDVAESRGRLGLPTVLFLGEEFDGRAPLIQMAELLGFDGPPEELLASLDAAAEAAGDVELLMIDALNEGDGPRIWMKALAGFVQDVVRYPRLALAVSCRTPFVEYVVPSVVRDAAAHALHRGFADAPGEALARYVEGYGIETPSFPMLDPEFTNPLFLKLFCTTLRDRGVERFPREGVALTWLYDAYLDAIDARLSAADRCDYDHRDRLARRAVEAVAGELLESGPAIPRERAREVVDGLLPGRGWATSLLKGLLDEGIIAGSLHRDADSIHFGYQRLGDVAVATLISRQPLDEAVAQSRLLAERWWAYAGVLEALAASLPEAHAVEIVDVVGDAGRVPDAALADLLSSTAWRSPSSVSERTSELVRMLVTDTDYRHDAYAALVRLATVPGHPLNADWLHELLLRSPLAERDGAWTVFCNDETGGRGPVEMLVDWAWSEASVAADDDVRRLAAVALGWFLASSSRPLRDTATKSLVHLLQSHPSVLTGVLRAFRDVDDPYVRERLLAVACGVALRSDDADEQVAVGQAVAEVTVFAGQWPDDILARDYARRAVRTAIQSGRDTGPALAAAIDPPYESVWPVPTRTEEEIDALGGPPDYLYSSVSGSLFGLGDFSHYVIRPRVSEFAERDDDGTEALVARRVFDRVLEFGWTPERFNWYDRRRHWEPSSGDLIERIGKKYQWIALHETLGRLADRNRVGGRYTDDPLRPYDDPSDIGARDIDPTVTVRESRHAGWSDSPVVWFSPVATDFGPMAVEDWIADVSGLPDPLLLIATDDPQGVRWLTMEGDYEWSEHQEPDEKALNRPYRRVSFHVRSYLFPAAAATGMEKWAATQDWWGGWMPEAAELHGVYLTDHPHHPSWRTGEPVSHFRPHEEPPTRLDVTTAWYRGSGTSYDQSSTDPVVGLVPSAALFELMGLRRAGDFVWADESGMVVATDPAIEQFGPGSLVVQKDPLLQALHDSARGILWTVAGEKHIILPDEAARRLPRWLEVTAAYLADGSGVRRVQSRGEASRWVPGGHWELEQREWAPPGSSV